jgi:hypothetical protein
MCNYLLLLVVSQVKKCCINSLLDYILESDQNFLMNSYLYNFGYTSLKIGINNYKLWKMLDNVNGLVEMNQHCCL